jgi:ribosome-binding factor A
MNRKTEKLISLLTQLAAEFLNRQSNGASLITVTNCSISDDWKNATVFITVLPDEKEAEALNFAKRQRSELRDYIKDHSKLGTLPFIEIEIDEAEKSRRRIDDLIDKG